MRNLRTFLAGKYANRVDWPTGNSERPVYNFPGNQEQARTVTDHFATSVMSSCRHLVALANAKFTTRTRAEIIPGRNDKLEQEISEISKFQEKGQPREVDWNFRNEFPEIFCFIRLWTGISENFGRMERAHYLRFPKRMRYSNELRTISHLLMLTWIDHMLFRLQMSNLIL